MSKRKKLFFGWLPIVGEGQTIESICAATVRRLAAPLPLQAARAAGEAALDGDGQGGGEGSGADRLAVQVLMTCT